MEADRTPEEQETLRQIRQASPDLETLYQLVEAFLHIARERTADQLDKWLNKVKDSHLQAFRPFVTEVQKDKEAILAGLTISWSTGPLEGQINRLKLIKRSMYGRAGFELLRLRVLSQRRLLQERKHKGQSSSVQSRDRLKNPTGNSACSQDALSRMSKVA